MVKDGTTDTLITINVSEFMTEIINYAALTEFLWLHPELKRHLYPTLQNWTDNMVAKAWARKAALKSPIAKALQRLLCAMMINNPLGSSASFIQGRLNVLADTIFRLFTHSAVPPTSAALLQAIPKLTSYRRFHPSPELLSHLYSALSSEQKRGLPKLGRYGHFSPKKTTL